MNNLSEKESLIIEFQVAFNDSVIESLVAFANTIGGTTYVGIAENGEIIGTLINNEILDMWKDIIQKNTSQSLNPVCKILTIEEKLVVSIHVNESTSKPVAYMGRHFKRIGYINHLMNAEEITFEYLKAKNLLKLQMKKEKPNTPNKKAKTNRKHTNKDKIIKLIKTNNNITLREIALKIGISLKGVERNIKILKAEGIIERVGADRGGHWRLIV